MNKFFAAGAAITAVGAGCFLRSEYEKDHFTVEELVIVSPKIRREKTLIFITDVHDKEFGPANRDLFTAVREIKPDGILIGGDLMVSKEGSKLGPTFRLLEGLAAIAPVFYSLGNHEMRLREQLEKYGRRYEILLKKARQLNITMLVDQTAPLGEIDITGVDLPFSYYRKIFLERPKKMPEGYLEQKLGKVSGDRFRVLLMHSPLYFKECRNWGADLTLAGHFHGGTIRIPFLGGLMTPQYQFFVPWCAGTFEAEGKWMAVGRGLGTHSVNIRLNDKAQLLAVKLVPDKDGSSNALKDPNQSSARKKQEAGHGDFL